MELEREYETEWQQICAELGDKRLQELRVIASENGVFGVSKLTKQELCDSLRSLFEQVDFVEKFFPHGVDYEANIIAFFKYVVKRNPNYVSLDPVELYIEGYKEGDKYVAYVSSTQTILPMKNPDKTKVYIVPIILFFSGIEPFDTKQDKESYEKEFIVSHQNVMVIFYDQKSSKWIYYRYEPYYTSGNRRIKEVDDGIKFILKQEDENAGYFLVNEAPMGPQAIYKGELCVFYCLYFVYMTIKYNSIVRAVNEIETSIQNNTYKKKFLTFIQNVYNDNKARYTHKPSLFL